MLLWDKVISLPKGRSELQRMVDIRSDIIRDGDSIFVATFQGNLAKVALPSGDIQWEKELSVYHTLAMDDRMIYLTDAHYHVWALDKATGEVLWEQDNLAERYVGAPVIMDDALVVGDRGGYLHWLNKDTGQIQANYFVGNKIVSDLIVDKKRIYISTQNGKLSVFKVT